MNGRRPRVLLVEDSAEDVELFQLVFADAGGEAEFSLASTGLEALSVLRRWAEEPASQRPRFVLLDLNLPVVHGHEVLAYMKAEPELRQIPVAVLTSSDAPADRARCQRIGCAAYMVKPRDLRGYRDLALVVRRMLEACAA